MNYIINPSWFYWIQVVSGLKIFLGVFAGILALVAFICFITAYEEADYDSKSSKKWVTRGTICSIIAVVFGVFIIFIPSKSTLVEMQIAKFATYENAEWTAGQIKEIVDYIINAIKSMK